MNWMMKIFLATAITGLILNFSGDRILTDQNILSSLPFNTTTKAATFQPVPPGFHPLITQGDSWLFLDDGSDQASTWQDIHFDDRTWKSGNGELGYGDGNENTTVSFGDDPSNKPITTYFRHAFYIAEPSIYEELILRVQRDDGVVVYLNDHEVFRSNMPEGEIDYLTHASLGLDSSSETTFLGTSLVPSLLKPGMNVIAAEIHQASANSSDISFDLELLGASNNTDQDITFAVVGDFGNEGSPTADVASLIDSWNPDVVITVGDNNYPRGELETFEKNTVQYYGKYFQSDGQQNRFFPTLGNHDWDGLICRDQQCLGTWTGFFTLPGNERYYDFIWGPVHFFAIDSDIREPDGRSSISEQARWLEHKLATSEAPWKIVYMHHPPFSSRVMTRSEARGSESIMQWPFQTWGASAVFAGHNHLYERIVINDFPYFTNGLGGTVVVHDFFAPNSGNPGSQRRYNEDHGAMRVQATDTTIEFQFITRTGEVIDTYVLFKS